MGRPSNTVDRAEELHAALLEARGPSSRIPTDTWNRIVCRHYRVGIEMAHKVTQTGAALGLWRRGREPGGAAYVELLAAEIVVVPADATAGTLVA